MGALALLAAITAWLVVTPPARRRLGRLDRSRLVPKPHRIVVIRWLPGLMVGGLVFALTGKPGWALSLVLVIIAATELVRDHQARRAQRLGRTATASAATSLALLLRSGMIPQAALAHAAQEAPCLASAAAAADLGGDVVHALKELSRRPGYRGFARVAVAWRVCTVTGAPIADMLDHVAERIRAEERLQALVTSELATARASSRIMAGLPVLGVLLGMAAGANPMQFFSQHWLAQVLLLIAVGLVVLGLWWSERIARKVQL